ncbi:MAG: hypothetical protein ACR2PT_23785 [Endozoicomonas sp.]
MSRRPKFSDEQILQKARELKADNKDYDPWAVRRALGNVGRPDRIERLLSENEVLVIEAETSDEQQLYNLPPRFMEQVQVMQQALLNTATEMYTEACLVADNRVKDEFESSRKARLKAEKEVTEAKEALNQLEDEIEQADLAMGAMEIQVKNLQGQIADLEQHDKDLQGKLKSKESELQKVIADNTELKIQAGLDEKAIIGKDKELELLGNQLDTATSRSEELQGTINTLTSERDTAKTAAAERASQVKDAKESLQAAKTALVKEENNHTATQEKLNTTEVRCTGLEQENKDLASDKAELEQESKDLANDKAELEQSLMDITGQLENSQRQLTESERSLAEAQKKLKAPQKTPKKTER